MEATSPRSRGRGLLRSGRALTGRLWSIRSRSGQVAKKPKLNPEVVDIAATSASVHDITMVDDTVNEESNPSRATPSIAKRNGAGNASSPSSASPSAAQTQQQWLASMVAMAEAAELAASEELSEGSFRAENVAEAKKKGASRLRQESLREGLGVLSSRIGSFGHASKSRIVETLDGARQASSKSTWVDSARTELSGGKSVKALRSAAAAGSSAVDKLKVGVAEATGEAFNAAASGFNSPSAHQRKPDAPNPRVLGPIPQGRPPSLETEAERAARKARRAARRAARQEPPDELPPAEPPAEAPKRGFVQARSSVQNAIEALESALGMDLDGDGFVGGAAVDPAKAAALKEEAKHLGQRVHALFGAGSYREALDVAEQQKSLLKELHGSTHHEFATATNNVAALYQAIGRHAEAKPLLREASQIQGKILGDDHPHTVASLTNLATCLQTMGDVDAATAMQLRVEQLKVKWETKQEGARAVRNAVNAARAVNAMKY